MEEEIEVNFRLDANGRTISSSTSGTEMLDYRSKTVQTTFRHVEKNTTLDASSLDEQHVLDEILLDAELSDLAMMPRTYWMPAQGFEPRCSLEQMALDIFHHHTAPLGPEGFDATTSGAEWWVQIRPSPENGGRYAVLDRSNEADDNVDSMSKTGISFHWDKDEDLRLLCGGTTYVHPHISTVTYLTSLGAPTFALDIRVNNLTGDWICPDQPEGIVCWPLGGKHFSFDGRFLHSAPPDLMEQGEFSKQQLFDEKDVESNNVNRLRRRHRRVTFLVNIWLNYHPFGVEPYPQTMIPKMSGSEDGSKRVGLSFQKEEDNNSSALQIDKSGKLKLESFEWPMGDCGSDESIRVLIPIEEVRGACKHGGEISMKWNHPEYVVLQKPDNEEVEDAIAAKRQRIEE